ncbi:hypothetical protein SAMN05444392_102490 [Seinonella peptonophila]|uniref:Uncharacterized protein n=1 Tax=Seinonella peptonophila TaxID=112248 RepID=A0A1M4VRL2_9BACL|nr:hypothetical protein [Seinonella peptonophila]SHE71500.1 hypothetical protein SAMN05444392_102490 [Seinonella peptonophila]
MEEEISYQLQYDERLGIKRPVLFVEYEQLSRSEQEMFEEACQQISSEIPDRIRYFEKEYLEYFDSLSQAEHEEMFEHMIKKMNDISRCISELNLLYLYIEGTYLGSNH